MIASLREPTAAAAATAILEWARARELEVRGGRGAQYPTLTLSVRRKDRPFIVRIWAPNGTLEFQLDPTKPPLDEDEKLEAIRRNLVAIPGIPWTKGSPSVGDKYPGAWLAPFAGAELRSRLLAFFDTLVDVYDA